MIFQSYVGFVNSFVKVSLMTANTCGAYWLPFKALNHSVHRVSRNNTVTWNSNLNENSLYKTVAQFTQAVVSLY